MRFTRFKEQGSPGNIRELANAVRGAIARCKTDEINVQDLGLTDAMRGDFSNGPFEAASNIRFFYV
jgi:DNA-binding NtrC family response regulator